MILIISDEEDQSTNDVIYWLQSSGQSYIRLNRTSHLTLISLQQESGKTKFSFWAEEEYIPGKRRMIHSDEITAFWYRRGFLNFGNRQLAFNNQDDKTGRALKTGINNYLKTENEKVYALINYHFENNKTGIGSGSDNHLNKLIVNSKAQEAGLKIPSTLVTSSKASFLFFESKAGACMAKAIDRAGFRIGTEFGIGNTNQVLRAEKIDQMPETFNATLFQQFISKLYDIRAIFINNRFYSAAILSQLNSQTKDDFRNYDLFRPNRIIPYLLPKAIESKLSILMNSLNLKS